jgi:adenine-specific DNA-methyltransferase
MLNYMLDVESRGSQSLLNIDAFKDPLSYTLKVKRPGSDESQDTTVDLMETFNWLIGLTVKEMSAPQCFDASFERDSEGRLTLKDRLHPSQNGRWWIRTIHGTLPNDNQEALVIWRNLPSSPEEDNVILNEWFKKSDCSTKEKLPNYIYVNGTNNLENIRLPDATWKVRLIEEDFKKLMFEMDGGL